jgi:ring-1,2-phenylacetyl-CoA epoxidase subunit PaaE
MVKTYTLAVENILQETADAVTIQFKQPALKKVKYQPGQYITLIARLNNRKYYRPYSISSVFGVDKTLNVTVKAIPGGIVSKYLVEDLRVGDVMEVLEPVGNFVLPAGKETSMSLVLWCAGSGITPCYSILRSVLLTQQQENVTLIYCNRNKASIIFDDELSKLQQEFSDRLTIYHILSKPANKEDGFYEGRLSRVFIDKFAENFNDLGNALHYICGPHEMMELIQLELCSMGVANDNIYLESFHNTISAENLVGVVDADIAVDVNSQLHNVRVKFGQNILDACLNQGIDIPYSCQTGSCTFCKAQLVEGNIRTVTNQKPEKEMGKDEYVLCCSFPVTPAIKLKVTA